MDEKDIGKNIRKLRKQKKLTLTSVAETANLAKGTLSKIERGHISTPISTLMRVADAIPVPLASFFTEPRPRPKYVVTRNGNGQLIERDGSQFGYTYEALAMDMPNKMTEPFILTVRPGDTSAQFQHEGEEFIYILSGKMELVIDTEEIVLEKGDSIYFDPAYEHSNRVIGKKPVRYLCVFVQECLDTY